MSQVHAGSVADPFATDAELVHAAARLLARAEFLGVLPPDLPAYFEITVDVVGQVLVALANAGVALNAARELSGASGDEYLKLLHEALEQTEHSPMPDSEWDPARSTLGDDLLADLLGISPSSLRRYATGQRKTPDDVAIRLHFIALLLAELAGGYNDYGIRRWFTRHRTRLDGQRPIDLLGHELDVDGPAARQLMSLATSMSAGGAT